MRTGNERLNSARAVGSSGCDSVADGSLAFADSPYKTAGSYGWYGFYTSNEVVITDVVFVSRSDGDALACTPSWEDETLPAGCWIPAGFLVGEDAYISSITCTGTIILYSD